MNHRIVQYILIILILTAIAGSIFYFRSIGATQINSGQETKLTDGLIGYWSFDGNHMDWSATGAEVLNQTGNNDGDASTSGMSSSNTVIGKIGQSLDFNGSSDYISVPDTGDTYDFGTSTPFTVSAWVKTGSASQKTIISKGNEDVSSAPGFTVRFTDTLIGVKLVTLWAYCYVGANTANIADNNWHKIDVVINRDSTCTTSNTLIYLDGVQQSGSLGPSGLAPNTDLSSSHPLEIGRYNEDYQQYFNGSMDEVRVYNRALTQTEITQLYNQGKTKINASEDSKLTDGLVLYQSFDGNHMDWSQATAEARDQAIANDGNIIGSTTPVIGKIGQALDFIDDTGTNYVSVDDDANLNITGNIAVSVWFKAASIGNWDSLVGKIDGNDSWNRGYLIYYNTGNLNFYASSYATNNASKAFVNDNEWHHVVGMYDGSNVRIFVDNVEGTADPYSGSINMAGTTDFRIGCSSQQTSNPWYFFDGLVDEVRVYNRALTINEISQLYNLGQVKINASQDQKLTDGLVGNWTFDGNHMDWSQTAAEARDQAGSYHGNTVDMDSSNAAIGKIGQALDFDGSTEYVDVGDIDITDEITASAWINLEGFVGGAIYSGIIAKSYPTSWFFGMNSNVRDLTVWINDSQRAVTTGQPINFNEWAHVAFTYDKDAGGTDEVKIYVNGSQAATGDYSTAIGTDDDSVEIGRNQSQEFDGKIDEVRLYDRALTADEINQLYMMGR